GNKRDRAVFDLYRVNLTTREHALIAENPGGVTDWLPDWAGRVRARIRHVGPAERHLEVLRDGGWAVLQRLDLEEFNLQMLGLTPDDRGLWLLSSRGRDRLSLVRVDVASGSESLVYDDPELDLEWVGMSERTREPLAVVTYPGRQAIRFFDAALAADLAGPSGFGAPGPTVLVVHGGHWARDYWSYAPVVQFLANRGYAVLQVNYRGSTGYGRAFRELAVGEYAGKMHDDLIDAVRWAA